MILHIVAGLRCRARELNAWPLIHFGGNTRRHNPFFNVFSFTACDRPELTQRGSPERYGFGSFGAIAAKQSHRNKTARKQ